MSISGFRHFSAAGFANALPRIARLGAVLLAHGGVAAWALSAVAPARLPPEPLRMDVSLIPYVAPVTPVVVAPLPPPQAEVAPQPLPQKPPAPEPAPARTPEPATPKPASKPKPKPTPTARPKSVEPVRQASPAPHPAADVSADAASVTTSATPLAAATAPSPPALVEARFDADYLRNPAPVYPPMSRRRGEQGKVLVLVAVTPGGLAGEVSLRESSGYPRLDEAALKAVRGWRFVPARRGDAAVATSVVVPITFRLEG